MELKEVIPEPIDLEPIKHRNSFRKTLISILYKIQKYSAYGFLTFFGLHSTSVALLPSFLPMEINQELFQMVRSIYLTVPFEGVIVGSGLAHVVSGVLLRSLRPKRKVLTLDAKKKIRSDEVGLGGITNLIGLGPKTSIISNLTNNALNPLTFSGYCLIPLLIYHFQKFKEVPVKVDGDNSLVSLQYINVVLNHSMAKYGNIINFAALAFLVYAANYHFLGGVLKFNNKRSNYWKRIGFVLINGFSVLGIVSLLRFKYKVFDDDYLFKKFMNYVRFVRI